MAGSNMTEIQPTGPTVLRMILGRQLRALRERAGLDFDQAAEAILVSPATVRRLEGSDGGLKPMAVKAALHAYGITDPGEIGAFIDLARKASTPGWWHSYSDVLPGWFSTAVGLEEAAALIRSFDPHWIPGLLQTPGYARAAARTGFPDATEEEIERRAGLLAARQRILGRPSPPALWAVIDEAALRRPAATIGPGAMREQLGKLIDAAAQPRVTLQILPFSAGLHPALGAFRLFRFDAPEQPDIVCCESLTSAAYFDKPDEAARYVQVLDRVSAQAAPPADTPALLTEIRKEI
ncbi:MAG: helix-turn-helix domain-containing protein [Nocardiopsaceae bacterium]|nr:helix-turn-helix domain-containing protein [Nocardiopsaceae bacterium]